MCICIGSLHGGITYALVILICSRSNLNLNTAHPSCYFVAWQQSCYTTPSSRPILPSFLLPSLPLFPPAFILSPSPSALDLNIGSLIISFPGVCPQSPWPRPPRRWQTDCLHYRVRHTTALYWTACHSPSSREVGWEGPVIFVHVHSLHCTGSTVCTVCIAHVCAHVHVSFSQCGNRATIYQVE